MNREINQAISNIIQSSIFTGGKEVKKFEESFAKYVGSRFCVAVANGSDALEIALESLNLPKNSEIILPANTFVATAEAVTRTNHKPVFCDCNSDYSLNTDNLKKLITSSTSAIILVHMFGKPCDIDKIKEISKELIIIEDCSHSHGAEYNGKKVGNFGDISTFSFNPSKVLDAYGDAGAILTNNEELEKKCRMIANHGRNKNNEHEFPGRNSKMDSLQAAVLNVKLKYLDDSIGKRIEHANRYREQLSKNENLILPEPYNRHVYYQFVIRTKQRDRLKQHLNSKGVKALVHYPKIIPRQMYYLDDKEYLAEKFSKEILSLPVGNSLTNQDIIDIASEINKFFENPLKEK